MKTSQHKRPSKRRFQVVEYSGHYSVRDTWTGEERVMSDGVDALSTPSGKLMKPGSEHFRRAWQRSLNSDPHETREAYFPNSPEF